MRVAWLSGWVAGQVPRFLSAHDPINSLFHRRRAHLTAVQDRAARAQAFGTWAEATGAKAAAPPQDSTIQRRFRRLEQQVDGALMTAQALTGIVTSAFAVTHREDAVDQNIDLPPGIRAIAGWSFPSFDRKEEGL